MSIYLDHMAFKGFDIYWTDKKDIEENIKNERLLLNEMDINVEFVHLPTEIILTDSIQKVSYG